MTEYKFTIFIERQPEGEYLVSVPALPGCYTEGLNLEDARSMAEDAIRAYCASLLKHGERGLQFLNKKENAMPSSRSLE